jgi:hypothetical protein
MARGMRLMLDDPDSMPAITETPQARSAKIPS